MKRSGTLPYVDMGSDLAKEINLIRATKEKILIAVNRMKENNKKIVSGGYLLLDPVGNVIGCCAMMSCLYPYKSKRWNDADIAKEIADKLGIKKENVHSFVRGFDNEKESHPDLWFLFGQELRDELKPESGFKVLQK